MKRTRCRWISVACLTLALPIAALADLSQTTTLQANIGLNLDTGATSAVGSRGSTGTPDILWNGSTITPAGNATAVNVGVGAFNALTLGTLTFLPGYSQASIRATDLVVNDVFAVRANSGHYAKVLVRAVGGGSITLQFTTFGATNAPGGPAITAILNNSSAVPPGFPNYGIPPSSLFVVTGSGLSDAGDPVLQSSEAPGIPLTLNGTSIAVVVNGVTTRPALYYTSPTQLAAVLPAATPLGTGTLVVTYKGANSAPAAIQVVPSAVGINTYNGSGVATDGATGALLTYINSGSPGQTIVLWGTGLGANPADSDTTFSTAPHPVNTPLQIYFGGVPARILYQGASGYPGVNQINVTIPESVPTGCWVPLVAVTGNVISNVVTFPINRGGGACVDVQTGYNGGQIQQLSGQAKLKGGLVSLIQTTSVDLRRGTVVTNSANAAFQQYGGLAAAATGGTVSPGGCIVTQVVAGGPIPALVGLDAGTITLTGPAGLSVTLPSQFGLKGAYGAILPASAISTAGGMYTFRGSGGADVGPFTSTLSLSSPLLSWTNQSAAASIDKTQGLLVTWTGGNPGTYVVITGTAVAGTAAGGYTCLAPVEARQFRVPSYILLGLPNGGGGTAVQNNVYSSLSATGIDTGVALADVSFSVASTYSSGGLSR
ncbi:MAG: hypothetical protein HYX27_00135 [Acidobacteria bacterium]|nr:hypothetical protein [Acidobacteriota bacterium]